MIAKNARQPTISSLIDLLIGSIADRTSLLDTFIILQAGFITAMYQIIGAHFGAQMLERLIAEFTRHHDQQKERYDGSKECANVIALLAEIYTFQVISSTIVFDIIKLLLTELTDLNTELLLRLIKSMCSSRCPFILTVIDCGPQLRQDDPTALKDVVFLLQKAVAAGDVELPVRTKFMIEAISNLKNNRLKTSNSTAITSEHVLRLKKTLGSLKTRSHATTEPLNVSLKDIQRAEKTGKWWLVGASWKDEKMNSDGENDATHKEDGEFNDDSETASADLLALAKQHRMNTNVRRAIFVAIMSSTDYKDAWLKLRRLSLNKSQRCEIPRVLVHCAGAEGAYNPYYRLVAGKLCSERAHQVSFRFNLWGVFRRMGDGSEGGEGHDAEEALELRELVNLAKMFGELIGTAALPITILKVLSKSMLKDYSLTCHKVLDFVQLKDQTKIFLEVLLVTALQTANKRQGSSAEDVIANIFGKAREEEQMATGLRHLLSKAVGSTELVTSSSAKRELHKAIKAAKSALAGVEVPSADL